jgi:hypothetical protein
MAQGDATSSGYPQGTPDSFLSGHQTGRVNGATPIIAQDVTHPLVGPISSRAVVVTAGTRVALGAVKARRVFVEYGEGSSGVIVIGGATVVAALATRNGAVMYGLGDWVELDIADLADVYVDSTVAADWVSLNYWTL